MGHMTTTLNGKVAVVTGATGGIGKHIAQGLALLGAHVVIGARDPQRGEAARAELAAAAANDRVSVLPVDVASQASLRAFASAFTDRHQSLDILVNNAGAWFTDRRQSPDGYELTLATNVLGPHLLTRLLLDSLRAAPSARVVNIISAIAGDYDATDLQFARRPFDGYKAYAQSKQALTMLTWGLAAATAGQGISANAAAPGFVRTGFNSNAHGAKATMINVMARLFAVSPAKGADTPLWVASAPELEGVTGKSFSGHKEQAARFAGTAQIASGPMLLSQQYFLGAAAFGPGYYTNDNGIGGTLELRWDQDTNWALLKGYQLYGFTDGGQVWSSHGGNYAALASVGAGARFFINEQLQAGVAVAFPVYNQFDNGDLRDYRILFSVLNAFKMCPSRPDLLCG